MENQLQRVQPLIRARQYRHFTSQAVADDDLRALVEVARWSGSSRNSQPWRFLVIRDERLIRTLGELGHPQTRSLHTAMAAIAISMPDEESRVASYAYDEGRVAERILIAAPLLGLGGGIAWARSDVRSRVAELLDLPAGRFVRTIVALGHPSAEGRARRSAPGQARLSAAELVRW